MKTANTELTSLNIMVCAGRHDIHTNEGEKVIAAVYNEIIDPTDVNGLEAQALAVFGRIDYPVFINLYVTGLTVATLSALKALHELELPYALHHYDRDSQSYYRQERIC